MWVFFNKTFIVYKENLPVTGRVLEEKNANNVDCKFKVIILHFVFTFFINSPVHCYKFDL